MTHPFQPGTAVVIVCGYDGNRLIETTVKTVVKNKMGATITIADVRYKGQHWHPYQNPKDKIWRADKATIDDMSRLHDCWPYLRLASELTEARAEPTPNT
jgi:hypothetical protein